MKFRGPIIQLGPYQPSFREEDDSASENHEKEKRSSATASTPVKAMEVVASVASVLTGLPVIKRPKS